MKPPRNDMLVAYDIRCPKRLRRIHRALAADGLAVQYSLFLCRRQHFVEVWTMLTALIDEEDDLRAWPLERPDQLWHTGAPWPTRQPKKKQTPPFWQRWFS